jgi:hypothetical protein
LVVARPSEGADITSRKEKAMLFLTYWELGETMRQGERLHVFGKI